MLFNIDFTEMVDTTTEQSFHAIFSKARSFDGIFRNFGPFNGLDPFNGMDPIFPHMDEQQ